VKCPLENQYFASYIAIAAVYFEGICKYNHQMAEAMVKNPSDQKTNTTLKNQLFETYNFAL